MATCMSGTVTAGSTAALSFGPEGEQGVPGPPGPQGVQGIQGAKGDPGIQGPQGLQGAKGDTGLTGSQGPIGATGPQGQQGIQGVPGPQGIQGPPGTVYIGDTPPGSPIVGQMWWESSTGLLFIRYDDGNSIQWVAAATGPAGPPGEGGGGGTPGGATTQVQFNDAGAFAGDAGLAFNKTNGQLTVTWKAGGYGAGGLKVINAASGKAFALAPYTNGPFLSDAVGTPAWLYLDTLANPYNPNNKMIIGTADITIAGSPLHHCRSDRSGPRRDQGLYRRQAGRQDHRRQQRALLARRQQCLDRHDMKIWSGSAWAEKPAKVWSGSAWVTKPAKVWTGSAWVPSRPWSAGRPRT